MQGHTRQLIHASEVFSYLESTYGKIISAGVDVTFDEFHAMVIKLHDTTQYGYMDSIELIGKLLIEGRGKDGKH